MKLPYYLETIRKALGDDVPLIDCVIVEELMRGEHGTLDALSAQAFRGSARRALRNLRAMRLDAEYADVVASLFEVAHHEVEQLRLRNVEVVS